MQESTKRAEALLTAVVPMPRLRVPPLFPDLLDNDPRRGLRRWVDTDMFVPSRPTRRRGVLVELHHDGTVVTAVDLSHNALPTHQSEAALPVATPVLVSTVCETVALVHKHRLALRMEAPIQLRAVLRTQANGLFRFTPVLLGLGRPKVAEWARQPSAVQPARSDLAPFADEQALFAGATEFAEGLLDQFGIEIIPP